MTQGIKTRPATPRRSEVGASPVGWIGIIILGGLYVLASLLLLYALIQLWPSAAPEEPSCSGCRFLWASVTLSRERNFFVIVLLAGALGSTIHGLRSASRYVGDRIMFRSWLLLYVFLPLIGASLGVLTYLVLRAGLISSAGVSQSDPFGFAAIAGMVGLFSAQAAEKLKQVFELLLTKPQSGEDSADSLAVPKSFSFAPAKGKQGDSVTIHGSGFDAKTEVTFGSVASVAQVVSESEVRTTVPPGVSPGLVSVTIHNPNGSMTSDTEFEVTE